MSLHRERRLKRSLRQAAGGDLEGVLGQPVGRLDPLERLVRFRLRGRIRVRVRARVKARTRVRTRVRVSGRGRGNGRGRGGVKVGVRGR